MWVEGKFLKKKGLINTNIAIFLKKNGFMGGNK